jgi:hypothetical protein
MYVQEDVDDGHSSVTFLQHVRVLTWSWLADALVQLLDSCSCWSLSLSQLFVLNHEVSQQNSIIRRSRQPWCLQLAVCDRRSPELLSSRVAKPGHLLILAGVAVWHLVILD